MNSPYPLPAPPVLITVLSYLTLAIHLLLMNLTLGGAVLMSIYLFKAREKHMVLASAMADRLPYLMAFTITFGIAPLLFAQALYSPVFYTSAIYLSGYFLLVPVNVFISYALLYLLSKKWDTLGKFRLYLYLLVVALLGGVMYIYNNLFAAMENLKEAGLVKFTAAGGYAFNPEYLDTLPRFLHFFFASVAISGLWVAVWGIMKLNKEPEQGRWQYRSGATWFSSATILVIATGMWWLVDIPGDSMMTVMGGDIFATVLFALLAVSAVSALVLALLGMNSIKPSFFLKISAVLTIFNVAGMVVIRDLLRQSQLAGFYDPLGQRSHFQWAAFLIFVLCLTTAVFFCYDLFRQVKISGKKN